MSHVLLAIPSASRRERQDIIENLEPLAVHVQTVPDFVDLISGRAQVDDIREVDVEDLLTRAPVSPNDTLMQAPLLGKPVLVTGAGGSISQVQPDPFTVNEPAMPEPFLRLMQTPS